MQRRWRDYRTPAGGQPVADFFDKLSDEDAAQVYAAMREVRERGLGQRDISKATSTK